MMTLTWNHVKHVNIQQNFLTSYTPTYQLAHDEHERRKNVYDIDTVF